MEKEIMIKKREPKDRIVLQADVSARITNWLEQLNASYRGLRMTRSDLVNHILQSHGEVLSREESSSAKDRYFDEVQFAEYVLRELREARKRGEKTSMADVMNGPIQEKPVRQKRAKKTPLSLEQQIVETDKAEVN